MPDAPTLRYATPSTPSPRAGSATPVAEVLELAGVVLVMLLLVAMLFAVPYLAIWW
jgi:hypothetical protein